MSAKRLAIVYGAAFAAAVALGFVLHTLGYW